MKLYNSYEPGGLAFSSNIFVYGEDLGAVASFIGRKWYDSVMDWTGSWGALLLNS